MILTKCLDFLLFQRWSLLLRLVLSILRSFDQRHYHVTFIWESTLKVRSFFRRVLSRQSGLVYSFDSLESHHHFPVHRREFVGCGESKTLDFSQRLPDGSGDLPTLFSRAQFFYLVQSYYPLARFSGLPIRVLLLSKISQSRYRSKTIPRCKFVSKILDSTRRSSSFR